MISSQLNFIAAGAVSLQDLCCWAGRSLGARGAECKMLRSSLSSSFLRAGFPRDVAVGSE